MDRLSIGVIAGSRKPDEYRLPIHPRHLEKIDPALRERLFLEVGYGARFGVADDLIAPLIGGLRSREQLIEECDVCLLAKPTADDVAALRAGQVLWGWPHCVQDETITQLSVDRKLTMIAWEAMNHWTDDGSFRVHVFQGNNELAGYCSVLHALQLMGATGAYGRRLRAAVISFGATARGAVGALTALGVVDVTILTHRTVSAVAAPIHGAQLVHFERDARDPARTIVLASSGTTAMAEFLAGYDIVVNCVLQDTDAPLTFVTREELELFAPTTLFVDVSCDQGMGFEWAQPTSFEDPMRLVGAGVHYYAVDHSPSYLWESATWEISEALMPYLETVTAGPAAWEADETIRRAIDIRDGVIQNPKILSFQRRSEEYPHRRR
ncbi:MAG TPA: N(5)-(carboxyethyl)ornithine synthase [Candidatus Saccharimonadales bacterium]|nr:N(5)-(carboxyethyl)ornithine synthase [Candidatus Saccharimonadales bacterium]